MWFVRMFISVTLFIGGSIGGYNYAGYLAPDSMISSIFGFFMFPLSFIVGMILWQGVAIIANFFKWVFRSGKKSDQSDTIKPPGSFMLIPPAIIIPGLAGIGMGFFSDEAWMWSACIACGLAGLIYGIVLFMAAQLKLLPIMKS